MIIIQSILLIYISIKIKNVFIFEYQNLAIPICIFFKFL